MCLQLETCIYMYTYNVMYFEILKNVHVVMIVQLQHRLHGFHLYLTFYHTIPFFNNIKKEVFLKTWKQAFSLFPHNVFYCLKKEDPIFEPHLLFLL